MTLHAIEAQAHVHFVIHRTMREVCWPRESVVDEDMDAARSRMYAASAVGCLTLLPGLSRSSQRVSKPLSQNGTRVIGNERIGSSSRMLGPVAATTRLGKDELLKNNVARE